METKRHIAKSGHRDADRLENWDALTLLLLETAKAHKVVETTVIIVTELELKTFLLQKRRTTP